MFRPKTLQEIDEDDTVPAGLCDVIDSCIEFFCGDGANKEEWQYGARGGENKEEWDSPGWWSSDEGWGSGDWRSGRGEGPRRQSEELGRSGRGEGPRRQSEELEEAKGTMKYGERLYFGGRRKMCKLG